MPMESDTLSDRVITSHALGCRGQIEARKRSAGGQIMPFAGPYINMRFYVGSLSIQDSSHIKNTAKRKELQK